LGNLDNLAESEVPRHELESLIEDIFVNMDEINKLFHYRFNCRLFCPPVAAQSFMSKATRGMEINLTDFVAAIGSVLDGLCVEELNALLSSAAKDIVGPINKFESLLKSKGIKYNADTLRLLRTLHHVRNTIFPVHDSPEIVGHLRELNVSFPIVDRRGAALKILQALNSALLDMKVWFLVDHETTDGFGYHG
jgi:hypothetical protein